MALPILPIVLLGGGALLLLASKKSGASETPAPALPTLPPAPPAATPTSPTTPPVVMPPAAPAPSVPPMPTALKEAIANGLRGLGIDPTTGAATGAPTSEAVEAATALAALLEAQGYPDAANTLRAYAAQAAASVSVARPAPLKALPESLSNELARALSLEGDPKRIRALVARVKASEWASNPQILATLAALEARATQLEKEQEAARTALEIEEITQMPDDFTLPPPRPPVTVPVPTTPISLPSPQELLDQAYQRVTSTAATTYTVLKGDYPASVAKKFTGDGNRWRELDKANPRYDLTKQFWSGMVLTLPPGWVSSTSSPTPPVTIPPIATPSIPLPSPPPTAPAPAPAKPTTYTVQSGDYPAAVAKKFTGDANRWRELDKANPRYDLTKQFWSGMVLTLPPGW